MPTYTARDDEGASIKFRSASIEAARRKAERWAADGYECNGQPLFIDLTLSQKGEDVESWTFIIDPEEPRCRDEDGRYDSEANHDWQTPHSILGGLKENPGVWGHGGGVIMKEVCMRCGCARITDTWATNPTNGTQAHTTVTYDEDTYQDQVLALQQNDADDDEE